MSRPFALKTLAAFGTAVLFAAATPSSGHADEARAGSLAVEAPWARAGAPRAVAGAAFLSIRNEGDTPDRLLGAETPIAARAELHAHVEEDGVMRMRPVDAVDIPADATAVLAPGGFHLMLLGLKGPLVEGGSFPLTLSFEKSGPARVVVPVLAAGASAPGAAPSGHAH
ncbi:copper chaperone PCu(A)C [Arenibaculum sp.]|jgi:hypothetical protein|uniref:copper chaperone PCu(A)C n=1 Tax=Arenibaculum sp. TaxID=2865862 RepID=UPI002E156E89|nr:copper chaperone PCu(A)C [Arenibaculum sp.]